MQLVVEDLSLERGGRPIVGGLSLTVSSGEALVLTGPNGAGKTTLIRAIAGFLPASQGVIRLDGGDPDGEIAEHCHFIGHRDGIKGAMTVAQNAAFFRRYLGGRAQGERRSVAAEAVRDVLARLGLEAFAEVPAAWLSAGQRRRLGLSRLLLAHRPLWLLDEPTVSLDAEAVAKLASIVSAHLARGGLVVAATHVPLGFAQARELRMGMP